MFIPTALQWLAAVAIYLHTKAFRLNIFLIKAVAAQNKWTGVLIPCTIQSATVGTP